MSQRCVHIKLKAYMTAVGKGMISTQKIPKPVEIEKVDLQKPDQYFCSKRNYRTKKFQILSGDRKS